MAGIDINNKSTFQMVCEYTAGVIVESRFVELLNEEKETEQAVKKLMLRLKK
jgi:tryptophan synthase alpha subunit